MGNRLRCNRRDCGGEGLSTETFLQQEGHDCADREHRPRGMLLQKRPGRSLGSARMCRQAADTHPTRSLRRGEKSGAGGGNACSPRPQPHSAGTCCTDSAGRWYRPRRTSPARLPRKGSAILPKRYVRVSITRSISAAKALPPARHPPSSCSERMEK